MHTFQRAGRELVREWGGRVPNAAVTEANRHDAGDVDARRRGAPTPQMPLFRRDPSGAWGLRLFPALFVVDGLLDHRRLRLDFASQAP